jgi:hypothetical protein
MQTSPRRATALLALCSLAVLALMAANPFHIETAVAQGANANAPKTNAPAPKKYGLVDPLNSQGGNIQLLAARAIRIVTGVSGSIGLLMFVYGGFTWLTSGGNPEKVKRGKQIFVTASVGLLIIFGSYALLRVVFRALSGFNDIAA